MNIRKSNKITILIIALFVFLALSLSLCGINIFSLAKGETLAPFTPEMEAIALSAAIALSLIDIAALVLLFVYRSSLLHREKLIRELFGGEADIMEEKRFTRIASRNLEKRNKGGYLAQIGMFAYKGSPISIYGPSFAASFNNIALDAIETVLIEDEKTIWTIGSNNIFHFYFQDEKDKAMEKIQSILNKIKEVTSSSPALPPVFALGGYAEGDEEGFESADNKASYALNHKCSTRLSGDLKFFDEHMLLARERYKSLSDDIDRAIANKEFLIYYQPKWNMEKKMFYGAEALIRWRHPQRGFLPPSLFIPAAESSGKIVDIDRYVFKTICEDLAGWGKTLGRDLIISFNLSRRSAFDSGMVSYLKDCVEQNSISPASIEIELTESLAAQFVDQIQHVTAKIKKIGFSTSMDDFGVGYSSLSSVKNIPFDVIKIDKALIDDIASDRQSARFLFTIIDLIHSMGKFALAEGIETQEQVDILSKTKLDAIQGYRYSRPLEKARFESFLLDNPFEKGGKQ